MAATPGYKGYLKNGANSYALVTDWNGTFDAAMLEITSINQGNAFKNYIAGLIGATLKASVIWDFTDTNGQLATWNALLSGATLSVSTSPNSSNAFSLTVLVKQIDVKVDVKKENTATLDLQVTGSFSYA